MPVQDTGSYSLDSPVQDILDERPEMLKRFREEMDVENVLGNGWKRWDIVIFIISHLMVILVYSSVLLLATKKQRWSKKRHSNCEIMSI